MKRQSMVSRINNISGFLVKGLVTAPCLPCKSNGDINLAVIPKYIDHLLEYGVPNVFATGTMGEGMNLTVLERKDVLHSWITEGKGKLSSVIAHIGAGNMKDSQELAKYAEEKGADAVSCVGPVYHKPQTMDDYVDYMKEVAEAAPSLPFYFYDIQVQTGINLAAGDFMTAAKEKIPTLRGLKHTTPNFVSMHTIIQDHGDRFQVLMGGDEIFLEGLAIGLETTILSSFIYGKILNRLKNAFDKGDMATARTEQERVLKLGRIPSKFGVTGITAAKATIDALFDLGLGQPRLPISPYRKDILGKIRSEFENAGFYEWGSKD